MRRLIVDIGSSGCNTESCTPLFLSLATSSSASVSMFYRNGSNTQLYPLQLPGCALDCPLEDFVRITEPSISKDWDAECQLPSKRRDRGKYVTRALINSTLLRFSPQKTVSDCATLSLQEVIVSLVVSGCVLFLLIAILLGIICWQKEPGSSGGYQHVINQEGGDESWQKYLLLSRRSPSLTSWGSSDDDGFWTRFLMVRQQVQLRTDVLCLGSFYFFFTNDHPSDPVSVESFYN